MTDRTRSPAAAEIAGSPLVFISHDTRDAELAEAFGILLRKVSAGMIRSFCSSDKTVTGGIPFGDEWYRTLMSKLDTATDVVCLLTERSVERPWILYEAGVAKGKLGTPVHGLMLGTRQLASGPFYHFQNCDDSEASLLKLLLQLCGRVQGLTPDEDAIKQHIRAFRQATLQARSMKVQASGNPSWQRAIPCREKLPPDVPRQVEERLDALRDEVEQLFAERGKQLGTENIRTNLLLPDFQFHDKSQFPGQLCFFASRPQGAYSKQELSNRFAPGEGVSGKVFLDGVPFAEDGRVGVSAKKLKLMHKALSAVAGFPLLDPDVRYAFGVVCIDFLDVPHIEDHDLRDLLGYAPVLTPIRQIAALLNPRDNESFELEFAARF
jgi:hypothetical protein